MEGGSSRAYDTFLELRHVQLTGLFRRGAAGRAASTDANMVPVAGSWKPDAVPCLRDGTMFWLIRTILTPGDLSTMFYMLLTYAGGRFY